LRTLLKFGEQVNLYVISIDSHEKSKQVAERIASDGKGAVTFTFLSDPGHRVIEKYGLRDPAYDGKDFEGIPHPAVYIIDKDGKVAWAKIESDYKQRPTNQEIRTALDLLK
jgi:peroxiredoxin